MFKKNGPEIDAENVGIMQGFKDMLGDLDLDEYEEKEMDDDKQIVGRTPDSPEILMNNLRGDMRSVDARVEELADLVGYGPAMDTPPQVLALLQPVLGAQQTAAAMPAPMMPPPAAMGMPPGPMPMPPGPMPAGPMPGAEAMPAPAMPPGGIAGLPAGQAPIPMAKGGLVQRFKDGSDDEGVTASDNANVAYPQELIDRARAEVYKYMAERPAPVPTLEAATAARLPTYRGLLGTDRSLTQAQMLFDIAQGGLNLAAGVDAEGRPLRGPQSAASRFAAGFSKVPALIGARAAEQAKEERAVKLAAIQAAEKDISTIRETNTKLIETQRRMFSDVIKASGTSIFGKGDWHWNVVNRPNLLKTWAEGKTSVDQDNLIDSAIAKFSTPRIETRIDPDNNLPYTVETPGVIPPFVQEAINQRKQMMSGRGTTTTPTTGAAPTTGTAPTTPSTGATAGAVPTAGTGPRIIPRGTPSMPGGAQDVLPAAPGGGPGAPPTQAGQLPSRSLWSTSGMISGPVSSTLGAVSGIPGMGDPFPLITQSQNLARQEVENLIEAFIKNDRAAVSEQDRLRNLYSVGPKFWDDPAAYRGRLIAIDEELGREMNKASQAAYNDQLSSKDRQKARSFLQAAEKFRTTLGVPLRIYSADDPMYKNLPAGAEYLWQGTIPMVKGGAGGRR